MWLGLFFFNIEEWLPKEWPEIDSDLLEEAVEQLASSGQKWKQTAVLNADGILEEEPSDSRVRVDLLRASCCLFWHHFYNPELYSSEQLQKLRAVWKYRYAPDESLDWTRAFINIHIDGALALHLKRTEDGYSEDLQGLIEEITRLASLLYTNNYLWEPGVYFQSAPSYFEETVPLKKSLSIVCSFAWSFRFFIKKAAGQDEEAFDCVNKAFECADPLINTRRFASRSKSKIEEVNASAGLVTFWLRCQEVVQVFDGIYKSNEPKVDWTQLAEQCEEIRFSYEQGGKWAEENRFLIDKSVRSETGKIPTESGSDWSPSYPVSEFWTYARGLCITRLSPDAYRKLRDQDERHTAEKRLKRYFFSDHWEDLSTASRDALIAADRAFWSDEGRKGDVLENIRLAIEPIIEECLVIPFRDWFTRRSKKTKVTTAE